MSWLKQLNIALLLIGLLITAILFQNCGQMSVLESQASLSSFSSWFDYPYTSKPSAYGEFYIFRPKTANDNGLYIYEVIGSVAPADNSNHPISYIMTVKDHKGATLCPTQTGTDRSIRFSCIGLKPTSTIIIDLTIDYDGESTHIQKTF